MNNELARPSDANTAKVVKVKATIESNASSDDNKKSEDVTFTVTVPAAGTITVK